MVTQEFRKIVAWLRKNFPIDSGVVVKRALSKKCHGITYWNGQQFYIRIDSQQDDASQIDALLHEWSHAVAINDAYNHREPWGIIYAKIFTDFTNNETLQ